LKICKQASTAYFCNISAVNNNLLYRTSLFDNWSYM